MPQDPKVEVEIRARLDSLERDLARARARLGTFDRATGGAARGMSGLDAAANKTSSSLRNVSNQLAVLQGPLGPVAGRFGALAAGVGRVGVVAASAGLAITGLTAAAIKAVRAFAQLEREQATYVGVLEATGHAAGRTAADIEDLVEAIRQTTTATLSDLRRASAVLLTFRSVSGAAFDDALRLSQDLAAVGFGSVTSAATMMGKALEDPLLGLTAMRRVGVTFSEAQKQVIKNFVETGERAKAMEVILDGVRRQVGGAGARQGDTLSGAWVQLQESTGNWFENVGRWVADTFRLEDALRGLKDRVDDVNASMTGADQTEQTLKTRLGELARRRDELESQLAEGLGTQMLRATRAELRGVAAEIEEVQKRLAVFRGDAITDFYGQVGNAAATLREQIESRTSAVEASLNALRDEAVQLRRTALEQEIYSATKEAAEASSLALTDAQKVSIATLVTENFHLKNGTALLRQRVALLGPAASEEERALLRTREIDDALRAGVSLRRDEIALIKRRGEIEAASTSLSERAALGLVSAQEAQRAALAELDVAARAYNMTSAEQAGALNALSRKYQEVYESSVVAASALPGLARAGLDAVDALEQIDTLGVSSLDRLASSIADVVTQSEDMGDAMRGLAQSVVRDLAQMIAKALIYRSVMSFLPGAAGAVSTPLVGLGGGGVGGGLAGMLGLGALGGAGLPAMLGTAAAAVGLPVIADLFGLGDDESAREQEDLLRRAQDAWRDMTVEVQKFNAQMRGVEFGKFANEVLGAYSQFVQLAEAANAAQDYGSLAQLRTNFSQFFTRIIVEFRDGTPVLGRVGDAITRMHKEAEGLWEALAIVGGQTNDVAVAIQAGLGRQLAELTDQIEDELVVKINSLTGQGYLSEVGALLDEIADLARLPELAGLTEAYFAARAQDIVDRAGLAGAAFDALIDQFPELRGVVTEFVEAAGSAEERLRSYQDRLFTATTDTTTLSGALAAFERAAQREREAELAANGEAIVALEATLAAERLNIIESFADQAAAAQRRALDEAQTYLESFSRSIAQYLDHLTAGSQSPLSPEDRLAEAQAQFSAQLALAAGADRAALDSITQYAENYREALRAFHGSGAEFQAGFAQMQADLASLPDQVRPEDVIVGAIEAQTEDLAGAGSLLAQMEAALSTGNLATIKNTLSTHLPDIDTNTDNTITYGEMRTALGGAYTAGTLRGIFDALDANGDGVVDVVKELKDNTGGTPSGTLWNAMNEVDANTGDTATGVGAPSSSGDLNDLLSTMKDTNATAASQLELLNGQLSGGNFWITTASPFVSGGLVTQNPVTTPLAALSNNMITALNKIVWNTWSTAYNTGRTAEVVTANAGGHFTPSLGVYASGGLVRGPPHFAGGVNINAQGGEYVVNARDVTWARPVLDAINFGHGLPAMMTGGDGGSLVAEVRALRAEVVALRRENSRVTAEAAIHLGESIAEGNALRRDENKRLRRLSVQ